MELQRSFPGDISNLVHVPVPLLGILPGSLILSEQSVSSKLCFLRLVCRENFLGKLRVGLN